MLDVIQDGLLAASFIPVLGSVGGAASGLLAGGRAAYNRVTGHSDLAKAQAIDAGLGLGAAGLSLIGAGGVGVAAKAAKGAYGASKGLGAASRLARATGAGAKATMRGGVGTNALPAALTVGGVAAGAGGFDPIGSVTARLGGVPMMFDPQTGKLTY